MEEQEVYEVCTVLTEQQAAVLKQIQRYEGKDKGDYIHGKRLAFRLSISERILHQIVRDLRESGYPILMDRAHGYYWPAGPEQIKAWTEKYMQPTINRMLRQQALLHKSIGVHFGQMGL